MVLGRLKGIMAIEVNIESDFTRDYSGGDGLVARGEGQACRAVA